MKFKHCLAIGTMSLLLAACGGSSNKIVFDLPAPIPAPSPTAKYHGIWLAPAYGQGIGIDDDELTIFEYTNDFCFFDDVVEEVELDDLTELFNLSDDNTQLEQRFGFGTDDLYAPGIVFSKAAELPQACSAGYTPVEGDDNYTEDYAQDLRYFYQAFKELSVSIERQELDWDAMYETAEQALIADPSDTTLVMSLVSMMEPLSDIHTSLGDEEDGAVVRFNNKPMYYDLFLEEYLALNNIDELETSAQQEAAGAYVDEQTALLNSIIFDYANDESDIKVAANDLIAWFEVEGIGYLYIAAMTGFAEVEDEGAESSSLVLNALESALDEAMSDLQNTTGLIIDVRRNLGGEDYLALAIASRFTDQEVVAYQKQAGLGDNKTPLREVTIAPRGDIQYLNPIVLLTSQTTVSAGEVFTMSMANLPHVTLIGEPTQGSLSDALGKVLPIGVPFSLSNETYLTPDGQWFEGQGIPVDVEVPAFTFAERLAEQDIALEVAFEYLIDQ